MALILLLIFGNGLRAQSTWAIGTGTWNTAANWTPNGVPTSGTATALIFNASGTTSYTSTNNIGTFTLNSLTVNNTGTGVVTITGAAAANTLTLAGTTPTITTTGSGITNFLGLFAGAGTIDYNGDTGEFRHDSNNSGFTGTLNVNSGTFRNQATLVPSTNFNASSIVVNNGGTYIFGNATVGDPNLPNSTYITVNTGGIVRWEEGESYGGAILNGGTVNLVQGGWTLAGTVASDFRAGTINGPSAIGGGAVINKTTPGTVTITGANISNTTGGLNILEGTLSTDTAFTGLGNVNLGATGFTPIYQFRGTTPLSSSRPLILTGDGGTVEVLEGTGVVSLPSAVVLNASLTKTGPGSLTLGSTANATSGSGGVTVGAGSVIVAGLASYTGPTQVNGGLIRFNPNATASTTAVTVAAGATVAVNSGAGTSSFTTSTLSLPAAGGGIVQLELATNSLPTAPLLTLSTANGLILNGGTQTLLIPNTLNYPIGTFTAIDYNGTAITSGFNLALLGRTAGAIVYNQANTSIDVNITGSDSIRWGGQVNSVWDIGTAVNVGGTNNFRLNSNNANTNFIQTDNVTFDDTAASFAPVLNVAVQPSGVRFNNSTNAYTLTGTGSITGTTGLIKDGTNTVSLATDNTYTGGTSVNAGTLEFGNGGTTGSATSAITLAGGATLGVNRSDAATFSNAITISGTGSTIRSNGTGAATFTSAITLAANNFTLGGSGPLTFGGALSGTGVITKSGAGTTTLLNNNNGFTGTVVIDAGTLVLNDAGAGGDFSPTLITVNTGATFQFAVFPTTGNTDFPATTYFNLNTGGTIIWNEGEDYGGINLFGGAVSTRASNNYTGTTAVEWQSGSMTSLTAPLTNQPIGGAGIINKTSTATVTLTGINLTTTGSLNIQQGTLATDGNLSGVGPIGLGDGSTPDVILNLTGTTTPTLSRPLTLNGDGVNESTIRVDAAAAIKTYSGLISGTNGILTKTGPGALLLTGLNTYTGSTTISAGALFVNGQAGTNSGTGTGPVTVASGATFGGNGRAAGAITIDAGATITAGTAPATQVLTAGSTVSLNGRYLVNLFGTGATQASRINAGGNVSLGGTSALELGLSGTTVDALRTAVGTGNTQTYTIVDAGLFTPSGTFNTTNFTSAGFEASEWLVNYNANTITLSFTPVPEPATILGLSGLVLAAGAAIRRRRK